MADFLPVSVVLAQIAAQIEAVQQTELLALRSALGRVLANDVLSPIDVPAHPNSAMDGYALRFDALQSAAPGPALRVVGTALAGQPYDDESHPVGVGEALRIMTGAVLPPSCDTVIPQEHCLREGETVMLQLERFALERGQNTRERGEDLRAGACAVPAGRVLTASDIGLLASLGLQHAVVKRRLRVVVFSTGDELVEPGHVCGPGQIYDSNRFTILAMLARLGVEGIDLGIVRDDPALLEAALTQAVQQHQADAIISSGGVSVGEADFTKSVLARQGEVNFWQIAMRPGRPLAFGRVGQALYFGLPGNPVAVMMTFYFFARPALLQLQGAKQTQPPEFSARCAQPIRKKPGRTEYQRAIIRQAPDGSYEVSLTGQQGSGVLSSMSKANCLIVLGHDQGNVDAGDLVSVVPFDGLL